MTVVRKDNDLRKYFLVKSKDGPCWPVKPSDVKKFRLGLRAVSLQLAEQNIKVIHKDNVTDGVNVIKNYKMAKMYEVSTHEYKVEY